MGDLGQEIANCFAEREGDEFAWLSTARPGVLVSPRASARRVIYTSKPACILHALETCGHRLAFDVIGGYGLPDPVDARRLAEFVGDRSIYFIGDCDPPDLLLFAWVRLHVAIAYLGVSDKLMSTLGVPLTHPITIPLAACEGGAAALLDRLCSDYQTLIGPKCAALLDSGRKLELEAVFSFAKHGLDAIEPLVA